MVWVALIALILSDICYMPAVARQQAYALSGCVPALCATPSLWLDTEAAGSCHSK